MKHALLAHTALLVEWKLTLLACLEKLTTTAQKVQLSRRNARRVNMLQLTPKHAKTALMASTAGLAQQVNTASMV